VTAKAGRHRTVRLPEELVKLIDEVRGTVARERWVRDALKVAVAERSTPHKLPRVAAGLAHPLPSRPEQEPLTEQLLRDSAQAVAGRQEAEQAVRTVPPAPVEPTRPRLRLKRPEAKP
jgi:hypothetical protein